MFSNFHPLDLQNKNLVYEQIYDETYVKIVLKISLPLFSYGYWKCIFAYFLT